MLAAVSNALDGLSTKDCATLLEPLRRLLSEGINGGGSSTGREALMLLRLLLPGAFDAAANKLEAVVSGVCGTAQARTGQGRWAGRGAVKHRHRCMRKEVWGLGGACR